MGWTPVLPGAAGPYPLPPPRNPGAQASRLCHPGKVPVFQFKKIVRKDEETINPSL
jgi:hypothetical protein